MKCSRKSIRRKANAIPNLKFEQQQLTSFAGLAVLQPFLATINLKARLTHCFRHTRVGKVYGQATVFLQLIIHFVLGYRDLRESTHYGDDPMVKRLLGLKRLPDVSTISRTLKDADAKSVEKLRGLLGRLVIDRLRKLNLSRVTLDFDGSVQSTRRRAEGTAVGFNKKKKGARSYYPLFCTIAQTSQVFDFLHRSGNVHDSHGARAFMAECVKLIRQALPHAVIEVRADSAFFSDELVTLLRDHGVEFTLSVPFERFTELKAMIENRKRWRTVDADRSFFEMTWRPKSWTRSYRFLLIRTRVKRQRKGQVQLDLFVPHETGFEFKVVMTNKRVGVATVLRFHEGRGSQEGIFGELKTHCAMGHVPVRRRLGNQMYLLAGLFAHNLIRELQMRTAVRARGTTDNRAALWIFERVDTVRKTLLQRAGRLTRPSGQLTLTISGAGTVKERFRDMLESLRPAA
jgi:DDE family transposase